VWPTPYNRCLHLPVLGSPWPVSPS
jgi:hypothetical protein